MKNYIYNIFNIPFLFLVLISCTPKTEEVEIVDFQLKNFSLTQLNNKGYELFRLKSSKANIDNVTNEIKAENVTISLTGKNKLFNTIYSEKCLVIKSKNLVILTNKVKLTSLEDKDSYLKADKLIWDINKSSVDLYGDINLKYQQTYLSSKRANYNDSLKKIVFSGLTKYVVYSKLDDINPLIRLSSDNAIINYNSKQIEFNSKNNQVKSTVNLDFN